MSRRNNVAKYMNEWRDGSWFMDTRGTEGTLETRVADEVVAYSGIDETPANVRVYASVVAEMIADGSLKVITRDDGWLTLEVE